MVVGERSDRLLRAGGKRSNICSVSRQISIGSYLNAFFTVFLFKTQILSVLLLLFLFIDQNIPFRKCKMRPVNPHKPLRNVRGLYCDLA